MRDIIHVSKHIIILYYTVQLVYTWQYQQHTAA